MTLIAGNLKAEHFPAKVWVLNGITYVPHYRNDKVFVGPGYGKHNFVRYNEGALKLMGAVESTEMLWSRSQGGTVNDRNP